jgi:large conductance mechanosensitive channel
MPMLAEFIQFLRKTNALALAVGVIIGAAVGKVVTSIVTDLLMPVIGLAVGGGDWRNWQIVLKRAADGKVLSAIGVGAFLGAVVDFVIIAFFVFMITRSLLQHPRSGHALPLLHEPGVDSRRPRARGRQLEPRTTDIDARDAELKGDMADEDTEQEGADGDSGDRSRTSHIGQRRLRDDGRRSGGGRGWRGRRRRNRLRRGQGRLDRSRGGGGGGRDLRHHQARKVRGEFR